MQLSILLFSAMSAGALALPTQHESGNTTSVILPRDPGKGADIASYTDNTCTTITTGSQKHYENGYNTCTKIGDLSTDFIGINWGAGLDSSHWVEFFSDDKCKKYASQELEKGKAGAAKGAYTCIGQNANGGPFKGYKFFTDRSI